jgi:hypothetical protein
MNDKTSVLGILERHSNVKGIVLDKANGKQLSQFWLKIFVVLLLLLLMDLALSRV